MRKGDSAGPPSDESERGPAPPAPPPSPAAPPLMGPMVPAPGSEPLRYFCVLEAASCNVGNEGRKRARAREKTSSADKGHQPAPSLFLGLPLSLSHLPNPAPLGAAGGLLGLASTIDRDRTGGDPTGIPTGGLSLSEPASESVVAAPLPREAREAWEG